MWRFGCGRNLVNILNMLSCALVVIVYSIVGNVIVAASIEEVQTRLRSVQSSLPFDEAGNMVLGRNEPFDHFVYAQQWPQSICIDDDITHAHQCDLPKGTNTWTVHGLWPTLGNTEKPQFCDSKKPFDPSKITDLRDRMEIFWPSLYNTGHKNNTPFWEHEWDKHGTCAQSLPDVRGEFNYFNKSLELNRDFDLLSLLKKSQITPRDNYVYPYAAFLKMLTQQLGFPPQLACVYDKSTKTQYIAQVEMCLSLKFEVIECPGSTRRLKRQLRDGPRPCWDNEDLAYPLIKH